MRFLLLAGIGVALAGCQTAQQRIASDDQTCQSYGVAPGTPGYVQCRMNLDTNRSNVNAAERLGQGEGLISRIGRMTQQ